MRLNRIPHKRRQAVQITGMRFDQIPHKLRLLLIADFVTLLGPITLGEIVALVKEITTSTRIEVDTELALGVSLGLFSVYRDGEGRIFYFHSLEDPVHLFDYSPINRTALRSEIYRIYRQRDRQRLASLQCKVFCK